MINLISAALTLPTRITVSWADSPLPADTPLPAPSALPVDPNRVTPGLYGFLSFVFLILAVVVIYFSMRKQLTRIKFDENAPLPAGVHALPRYATKAERRKSAAAQQAAIAAAHGLDPAQLGDPGADDEESDSDLAALAADTPEVPDDPSGLFDTPTSDDPKPPTTA